MTDTPSREGRGEIRERRRPPEPRIVRAPSWGVLLPALLLLPGALTGQVPEEKSYAPEQMLGCDFTFAVFAPARGEPRTVRRCPGADGGPFFFARSPVVDLTHLDSVAAAPAGAGSWRVDARLTGEGARRLEEGVPEDGIDPVGIVLDGRVVSRFTPRSAVRSDRLVVLDGVSEARAREVAERLRTEAWRASARRDGGLCRLLRHLRPGGALDRAYREEREELMEVCGDVRGACGRDRHAPRDVIEDSVRTEARAGAPAGGVLVGRVLPGGPHP